MLLKFICLLATLGTVLGQSGHPGFHATLTNSNDFTPNGNIIFNNALFNADTAYSSGTGVFTCPSPGLYFFSFTLKSTSLKTAGGTLIHRTAAAVETALTSADTKNSGLDSVTAAAVVNCATSDTVFVRAIQGTPEVTAPYNTFTGYKLLYGSP